MNHITPQSGIPTNLKRLPWARDPDHYGTCVLTLP
jgi:hypothetical protein